MTGVTAAGAGIYLNQGYIDPGLAMPVMLGARMLVQSNPDLLRKLFSLVILVLAVQIIFNGISGRI